jgi:HK97 family phage prohead protease
MAIQTGTDTVYHTPHEVLQSALADSVLFLEKATVGRAQMSDISDALSEYKRLFSVKLASPAEILTLSRAYPDNQKYAKAAEGIEDDSMPVVVGGPASVEMVDREGHLITTNALTKAFKKYMANFRTRNTMVMHSDVQVGWALPAYITKGGSVFRSGVDPKGLFFITELRNDTRIAAKVKEQIESGKMRSYSIAGNATESKDIHREDGTKIMQVDNLELAEVTICEKGVNQGAHFDLMKGMILDKEQSTSTTVSSNDLLLEETLSKGVFSPRRKKDMERVKDFRRDFSEGGDAHKVATNLGQDPAKLRRQATSVYNTARRVDMPPRDAADLGDAAGVEHLADNITPSSSPNARDVIQARSAANKAKAPKIEESLNKSTPMLGMFQEFMEKAKGPTDTPLGLQTNHPDQQGEDDRRAQLKRIQEEFGLPEETQSAEYNRRAPVDYKMPHSFSSSRVVNQSGQDSAVARTGSGSTVDKVLSKLFQKAGQNKEDRTPGNSAKPNEFPADTSTSPYQSKGVFEKAGDDLRQDGITNHPSRRSPLTKPEDDRSYTPGHFEKQHVEKILPLLGALARTAATVAASTVGEAAGEKANEKLNLSKAGLYENIHAKRKSGKRMRSEGDSKAPTDADFKDAAKSLTKDATGTTNRGFRQEGGAGRKASFQGIKGNKPQRPNKYKDIDRTTGREVTPTQETDFAPPALKSIQKKDSDVKVPGMGQQRSQQGPTSNWGDPTRAAQPTMRQRQPWDEKSMEKNEDEGKTLPSKPSLNTAQAPKHDVSGAAANRARVEAAKGKDAATQYKAPRDPANKIIDSEAKKKKSGWAGFPSSRSSGDFDEKSLSKTNPDPVEEGKAILAMPFNLATQMIMGKKAPSAVSADDRLRESVLVLLKQSDQRFGNV